MKVKFDNMELLVNESFITPNSKPFTIELFEPPDQIYIKIVFASETPYNVSYSVEQVDKKTVLVTFLDNTSLRYDNGFLHPIEIGTHKNRQLFFFMLLKEVDVSNQKQVEFNVYLGQEVDNDET